MPDTRLQTTSGLAIDVRSQRESAETVVVLVPGVFATSSFFRVSATAGRSFHDWLVEDLGRAVVSYDPRGLGVNRRAASGTIDFAGRLADLDEVIACVHCEHASAALELVGHSFGGTTIYGTLARAARARPAWLERIHAVVTVGSPARLEPRDPPWERLFTDTSRELLDRCARGGWIDLDAFSYVQNEISTAPTSHVPLWAVRIGSFLARHLHSAARAALESSPLSSFLVNPGDYTVDEFQAILRARGLERESQLLLQQLIGWGSSGAGIELELDGQTVDLVDACRSLDVFVGTVSSPADQLVHTHEVQAIATRDTAHAEVSPCGHGGYFYRSDSRRDTLGAIREFLERR